MIAMFHLSSPDRYSLSSGIPFLTTIAFLLVTLSAFMHAFWNFLGKRRNPPAAFFLMASLAAGLVFSPTLFLFWNGLFSIPRDVWGLIILTGAVQAIYYFFLAAAYRSGDLSHAYPMTRALPVVFIAIVSVFLGRGDQIQPLAYVGFAVVTVGCILLPLPRFNSLHPRHYRYPWIIFALLAALCITAYTLLDDQALRMLRAIPVTVISSLGWSLLFVELETLGIVFFMGVILIFWRSERLVMLQAPPGEWRHALLVGIIITATYGLVLLAMAYVRNVSYVFALRQLSIPIGAALGILIRKESATIPKLVGITLVITGLILTALG